MAGDVVESGRVSDPDAAVPQAGSASSGVVAFRAWLGCVDVGSLSDRERVGLVAELERVKGSVAAVQARATDALRCSAQGGPLRDVVRSVGSQVALARREPPSLGDRFVGLSRALVHEMPCTMAALVAGVVGERHAVAVVAATACLSRGDRAEVDRRLGAVLGRLTAAGAGRAAARVAAELDAASVVARMEAAVRSRRVTVRPAPDGMAYLSVLGPVPDVVGAHAALLARARAVVGGQCEEEGPQGRGVGAVAADTALRLLSGRAVGEVTPVEVHLVMTDRSLLGTGDATRSVFEPARVPGHGSVPAPVARAWLREDPQVAALTRGGAAPPRGGATSSGAASVWVRRLYTGPGGRDLVAMDSRRRVFTGLLRRMLVLRDDVCATPWCQAPIVHADHTRPARSGGPTEVGNGTGLCARCNQVKEAPGWSVQVIHPGPSPTPRVPRKRHPAAPRRRHRSGPPGPPSPGPSRWSGRPREIEVRTPTGHTYRSQAPPLTGWGWHPTHPPRRPRTPSRLERRLLDRLAAA